MALIELSRRGPVVELTLNRPDARNALSVEVCDQITAGLEEIDSDPGNRAIVVRGAGKVFCSGADFAAVSGPDALRFLPSFDRMLEALATHRLPTIASIHGAALGGGLQLATACDFRIAASDASIGIPSPKIGIVVNFENVQRLVLLAGIETAKEVLMTGRSFDGDDAEQRGLVSRSVPPGELEQDSFALADEIAALAPLSVQGAKRAIGVVAGHLGAARAHDPAAVEAVDALVEQAYRSEDLAEGLRAMADKRPPRFTAR